jgi:transcriptional regulator with XRE-family HTH domain
VSKAVGDSQARLAAKLRQLRTAAGLGGIEAGRRAGISQSKISKIENQTLRPSPDDVGALCQVYGVPPEQARDLARLADSLRSETVEPRRVTLSRGAYNMQQRIRRLEASASLLRSFQPCMIIGLLQTEAYAGLVFGVSSSGPDIDRAVAARLDRQATLRDQVPRAVLIMTEGALRWQAGSPHVMIEQLHAIAAAAERPNVDVGIIPYTTPVTVFPRHGFHLYDSDAVIIGTETGTATIVDNEDIASYEQLFVRLEQHAATGDAARAVLARVADDYRKL